ncbi:hypothetical protein SLEP1_g13959 [Rubroshorea leprosula]|uniref:BHLH domain-containing protein n=1 Tax=Rubroshorea leprosula TaxID=152421 RepID=A0AAV5IM05_9ROSI|nr:hypothetical protein SLEP1_g13959 [Rubroshorea leprosula]
MASLISSDPDTSPELNRKKRKRSTVETNSSMEKHRSKRWRTDKEQQIYSLKLFDALRGSRRSGREVRVTADRVLAVSARGATRWSRAILTSQLGGGASLRNHKKAKVVTGNGKLKKQPAAIKKENRRLPAVVRRVKVLGGLVPGCRKLSLPNLLEEATDYIAALEMQVRAMTALTQIIGGGGAAPPPADHQLGSS